MVMVGGVEYLGAIMLTLRCTAFAEFHASVSILIPELPW